MFYSSAIISKLGLDPRLGSGLVGFVNMAATALSLVLLGSKRNFILYLFIEFGRKTLLWTLSFAMAGAQIGLGVCYFYVDSS